MYNFPLIKYVFIDINRQILRFYWAVSASVPAERTAAAPENPIAKSGKNGYDIDVRQHES